MNVNKYMKKRDFFIWGKIGVCATTRVEFVEEAFSMPTSPISATIVLIGVPALISAKENRNYMDMYNKATMAAIDGMPIVKIGRRLGYKCERCAAPDIMGMMFSESVKREKTHYFYGGNNDEVLFKLRQNLEKSYPGIKIVGMYSPPFRPLNEVENRSICDEINKLHPDFLWVGLGAPKQEMWMTEHQNNIHDTVMIGVGAGFNFYAGTLEKAPEWMEEASLEWLFRLSKEPKRLWKRYIIGGIKYIYYSIESKL